MDEQLLTAPALPAGFSSRPAAMADAAAVTDMLNADSRKHLGVERYSLNECEQSWTEPGFDLANSSMMVLAPGGQVAGFIEVWDTGSAPIGGFVFGATHPDFYGLGIGSTMLTWGETRARKTIDRLPPDHPFSLQAATSQNNEAGQQLFQDFGMERVRTFYTMRIDLNGRLGPPQLPPDVRIVELTHIKEPMPVINALEDAFEDHFNHEHKTEEERRERFDHMMSDPAFDPTLCFAAYYNGDLAGALIGYPLADEDPTIGHVSSLGVLRPYRRKGIAQALLEHSFAVFSQRPQFKAVQLGVDASSNTGANKLYLKAGMHVVRATELFEKNLRL